MTWAVAFLNERVRDELSSPPVDVRARFGRIVRLVQSHGLEQIREPYVRHLEGPLWEMRLTGKGGIARALYVTARDRRVVIGAFS